MAGEFEFIEWICSQQKASELLLVPPGDDLAVLRWSDDLLVVGADQCLDGVHFDTAKHSPRAIGRKVMNRNLSDCAAMGCLPAAAIATVALPRREGVMEFAKELYLGMCEAGEVFNCPVVGGDTSSWSGPLAITATILGRSDGVVPITRKGARPGDFVCVTGPLGGSILGRHMNFSPRVLEGRELARSGLLTAMIDISDGLSRDLRHICRQSGIGAIIDADSIPIHDDAIELFAADRREPIEHALHDGEDYELLYTCSATAGDWSRQIGIITAEPGIFLRHSDGRLTPLEPKGWEHAL